jgi:hypothetical protein
MLLFHHVLTKIKNDHIFLKVRFKKILVFFTQKIVTKFSEIWVGGSGTPDPGYEIRKTLTPDPDPGVKDCSLKSFN